MTAKRNAIACIKKIAGQQNSNRNCRKNASLFNIVDYQIQQKKYGGQCNSKASKSITNINVIEKKKCKQAIPQIAPAARNQQHNSRDEQYAIQKIKYLVGNLNIRKQLRAAKNRVRDIRPGKHLQ